MKNYIEENQYLEDLKCKLETAKQENARLFNIIVIIGAVALVALIIKLISNCLNNDCCGDCDCDCDDDYEYEYEDEEDCVYEEDFE